MGLKQIEQPLRQHIPIENRWNTPKENLEGAVERPRDRVRKPCTCREDAVKLAVAREFLRQTYAFQNTTSPSISFLLEVLYLLIKKNYEHWYL